MADQSDQRIVDIRQESKIDPTRVTQRVLRSVLVSVAIIGGSVAVLVERRAARVVGIARCGVG